MTSRRSHASDTVAPREAVSGVVVSPPPARLQAAMKAVEAELDREVLSANPLDVNEAGIEDAVERVVEELLPFLGDPAKAYRARDWVEMAARALAHANLYLDCAEKLWPAHIANFYLQPEVRHLVLSFYEDPQTTRMFDPEDGVYELLSAQQQTELVTPVVAQLHHLEPPTDVASALYQAMSYLTSYMVDSWSDLPEPGSPEEAQRLRELADEVSEAVRTEDMVVTYRRLPDASSST